MADSNWMRLQNFVDMTTNGNFKLAFEIFNQHDSLLHGGIADTDVLAMYNYFHPFKIAYFNAYTAWENVKGLSTGGTQGLVALIDDLSANKIRIWDVTIQTVYDQKSTKYKALLPHRRNPFQAGPIELRIAAVNTLLLAIGSDASLAALKAQVQTFYNLLVSARDNQQGNFSAIDLAVTNLETTRLAAAQAMFKNYGSLIVKYFITPDAIANYVPIELLQTTRQMSFTGHTNAGVTHHIFKRKLDEGQHLMLTNNSNEALEFYFTNGLNDAPLAAQLVLNLPPQSQKDIAPADAGYSNDNRHFYIHNAGSGNNQWKVVIE